MLAEYSGQKSQQLFLSVGKLIHMSACHACRLHTGASVAALELLRDSLCKGIPGELTRMWVNATDERKWHRGAVQALMKASLFVMPDVDACLAKVCHFAITGHFLDLHSASKLHAKHATWCLPSAKWFNSYKLLSVSG